MKITFDTGDGTVIATVPENLQLVNLPNNGGVALVFAGLSLLQFGNVLLQPKTDAPSTAKIPAKTRSSKESLK